MADAKKASASAAALLAAALAGAGVHSQVAPPLPTSAMPIGMRWLNNGPDKPVSFALGLRASAGSHVAGHEIVCEVDAPPRLDGRPFPDASELCAGVVVFGKAAIGKTATLAEAIARAVPPAPPKTAIPHEPPAGAGPPRGAAAPNR